MSVVKKLSPRFSPQEQYEILSQGSVDLINKEEFLDKLKLKRTLRVKAGFDPSSPDIHIGHALLINKLRQFQELGHEVFFIVGDFTACIGDPSGQNKTRPTLSFQEVKKNADSYFKQVTRKNFKTTKTGEESSEWLLSFFKRLDPKKTKLLYNSQWLDKISLRDFILSVSSKFTVARQLERNDFSLRYKSGKPIFLHEFFYPVLQAYDSVELKADVELGGTDQLFNLLLGRDIQEHFKQSPQIVLTFPLLEGLDGEQKMSKSLNNAISFNDSPKEIYGKAMKISDKLLVRYWKLFTEGRRDLEQQFKTKSLHPKTEKEKLAWALVCALYGEEEADKAQEEFVRIFSKKGLPDKIAERAISPAKEVWICQLVKEAGLCTSSSEAKRGILSGAVRKNGEKLTDPQLKEELNSGDEFLLSFGKRKFVKVKVK